MSARGFWLSFSVALLAAPLQLYLSLARYDFVTQRNAVAETPIDLPAFSTFVASDLVSYFVMWAAFPLLMVLLTKLMEVQERFTPYIIARNWSALLIYLLLGRH